MLETPAFLPDWLTDDPRFAAALYGGLALLIAVGLFVVWIVFGTGPRRRRAWRQARRLLRAGDWAQALAAAEKLRSSGSLSAAWRRRFDDFEAECLKAATEVALAGKEFESALEYSLRAAPLLGRSEIEARASIQNAMLHEVRRLFASPGQTRATTDLIARTLLVQAPCREASFWQALCELRSGESDEAMVNLQRARTGQAADPDRAAATPSTFIDPPLYLGTLLLLRKGEPREAIRLLTDANRIDPGCPFVTLQLGVAMMAAGSDTQLAVRALERALGPRGLGRWQETPQRAWAEGLPEQRSFIRKLATEFPFTCPIWGSDLIQLQRQGHLALAQGQYRLGNFPEAARLFDLALKEGAPSLVVLRGLGLSLAKLGRFDDAFKHLLTAHDMEQEKDRLTAGYLALCGACGTPTSADDRASNIAWAVRTVQKWSAPADAEWVHVIGAIWAKAREHGIPLNADDQLYLCEHLVAVAASDPAAAAAFHHLMATFPRLMHPEYAWLYCRADEQHKVGGAHVLELYAMTFATRAGAEAFFAARGWDFAAVEFAYLARAAELAPGRFPEALGPDYPAQAERLLMARSEQAEQSGQSEAGLEALRILLRLAPSHYRALDRAARLHYRAGRIDEALALLETWRAAEPAEPLPVLRQAIVLHEQQRDDEACAALRQAVGLAVDQRRARIAHLAARLHLQAALRAGSPAAMLQTVREFVEESLRCQADQAEALWIRAALCWLQKDTRALAEQAAVMDQFQDSDARYHYLAAVCHLAAGAHEQVLTVCRRVQELSVANRDGALDLALESRYLAARALLALGRRAEALAELQMVARGGAPSASLALALLGHTQFLQGSVDEALRCWDTLDMKQRQSWGLAEPLSQAVFAAAVGELRAGRYEAAADQLRRVGRLGCRDGRLGHLLLLSLFKAGQHAVYGAATVPVPQT